MSQCSESPGLRRPRRPNRYISCARCSAKHRICPTRPPAPTSAAILSRASEPTSPSPTRPLPSMSTLSKSTVTHRSSADTGIVDARAGQEGLKFLRRANQGEGPCIQKALWFFYRRLGRRSYALLDDLLKPDLTWPTGSTPLQQLYRSDLKGLQYFEALQVRAGLHVLPISKQYLRLRALLTSQSKQDINKK